MRGAYFTSNKGCSLCLAPERCFVKEGVSVLKCCFSHFSMQTNHLGFLSKCRVWKYYISKKLLLVTTLLDPVRYILLPWIFFKVKENPQDKSFYGLILISIPTIGTHLYLILIFTPDFIYMSRTDNNKFQDL